MEATSRAERERRGASATARYEPVRLLGRGGMGVVHEVVDRLTGRRVALKKILAPDPRQQLRLKREFRMMVDLRHPNLVRLFDLGYEDDGCFFTMEIVDGPPQCQRSCRLHREPPRGREPEKRDEPRVCRGMDEHERG